MPHSTFSAPIPTPPFSTDRPTTSRGRVALRVLTVGLLGLTILPLVVGGCAVPVEKTSPVPSAPEVGARSYRTVVVDSNGRADHGTFVCYLAQANVTASDYGEEKESVVYIQDENFDDIGFYLSSGAAYRLEVDRDGNIEQTFLGNHEPSRCVELLTGVRGPFLFRSGV